MESWRIFTTPGTMCNGVKMCGKDKVSVVVMTTVTCKELSGKDRMTSCTCISSKIPLCWVVWNGVKMYGGDQGVSSCLRWLSSPCHTGPKSFRHDDFVVILPENRKSPHPLETYSQVKQWMTSILRTWLWDLCVSDCQQNSTTYDVRMVSTGVPVLV